MRSFKLLSLTFMQIFVIIKIIFVGILIVSDYLNPELIKENEKKGLMVENIKMGLSNILEIVFLIAYLIKLNEPKEKIKRSEYVNHVFIIHIICTMVGFAQLYSGYSCRPLLQDQKAIIYLFYRVLIIGINFIFQVIVGISTSIEAYSVGNITQKEFIFRLTGVNVKEETKVD